MNLQYLSDKEGKTTGVFIPIEEWNALINKYKEIETEALDTPDWQKEIVLKRLADFKKNPDSVIDFDLALTDIEKNL